MNVMSPAEKTATLAALQVRFDKLVADLQKPGAMQRALRAAPEPGQKTPLGPSR